jgi:hypothetical protein
MSAVGKHCQIVNVGLPIDIKSLLNRHRSAGLMQVTIRGAAAQYSLPWAWQQIPSSRLQFSGNHLWSEGCFPTVVPIATCVVVLDPPEIRKEGSLIIYSDGCTPMGGLELPGDVQVNVNGCTNGKGGYDLYYSLFGSFLAGGTGSQVATQVRCSVEIEEKGKLNLSTSRSFPP